MNQLLIIFIICLSLCRLQGQFNYEKGRILLKDSTEVQGKVLFKSLADLLSTVVVQVDGEKRTIETSTISSINIGNDKVYENIVIGKKDVLVQKIVSGNINLYYTYDDWLYFGPQNTPPKRLEAYVISEQSNNVTWIDTVKTSNFDREGKFFIKKEYLRSLVEGFQGTDYKFDFNTKLTESDIKNLIYDYNKSVNPKFAKKLFTKNTTISLFVGYGQSTFEDNQNYRGVEYYVEVQNRKISNYLGFIMSYRPSLKLEKSSINQTTLGIKSYIYAGQYISPYVIVTGSYYGLTKPQLSPGIGCRFNINQTIAFMGEFYGPPYRQYRFGVMFSNL